MKGLRDITVVIEESAQSEIRLAIAIALAQQHNAHLTGLFALDLLIPARSSVRRRGDPKADMQSTPQLMNWGFAPPLDYPEVDTQPAKKVDQIEAAFRERLRFSSLQGNWRVASDDVSETVVCQARQAYLIILDQVNSNHLPPLGRHLIEAVLMTSGCPILVILYIGRFETVGTEVLVAWANSREAVRAMNDAIPLLAGLHRSPLWR